MNMSNTEGPPMIATVPEVTPASALAVSKEAPAGFHSVAFGFAGSGAVARTLRVTMMRLRCGEFGWSS